MGRELEPYSPRLSAFWYGLGDLEDYYFFRVVPEVLMVGGDEIIAVSERDGRVSQCSVGE